MGVGGGKRAGGRHHNISPQSLILDGLVLATGVAVSGAVLAVVDSIGNGGGGSVDTRAKKVNPLLKLVSAGVLVAGTAVAARTVLRVREEDE